MQYMWERYLLEDTADKDRIEENKATEQIKKNSKAFYAFARSRQRAKAKVGPFKDSTGTINPDPTYTVEAGAVIKTRWSRDPQDIICISRSDIIS